MVDDEKFYITELSDGSFVIYKNTENGTKFCGKYDLEDKNEAFEDLRKYNAEAESNNSLRSNPTMKTECSIVTEDAKSPKDFMMSLKNVDMTSSSEMFDIIKNETKEVPPESMIHLINVIKKGVELLPNDKNETKQLSEGMISKSFKEIFDSIFSSLSFYTVFAIFSIVDKVIKSDDGFKSLTAEQKKMLPVYISVFFGIVGSKIAYKRLKDYFSTENIDKEISETLKLAGIQLDEDVEYYARAYNIDYGLPSEMEIHGTVYNEDDIHNDISERISDNTGIGPDDFEYDYEIERNTDDEDDDDEDLDSTGVEYDESYNPLNESVESNLDDAVNFVRTELESKFGSTLPENDDEKDYVDDLINMATMKFNVPEDSLRNALGLVEEEAASDEEELKEPSEEVPGEEII